MKQLLILSISLFLISCSGKAQNKAVENQVKKNTIEVFDFHTTNRCITCKAIEANTKYTLETYFAKELKSGKVTFKVINIDLTNFAFTYGKKKEDFSEKLKVTIEKELANI